MNSIYNSLFLATCMMVFGILIGYALLYFIQIFFKSSHKTLNDLMPMPYAALTGVIGYSFAYALLGMVGSLNLPSLLIVMMGIISLALAYATYGGIKYRVHLKYKNLLPLWILIFFLPILFIGFLVASLPTSNWDVISYELTIPKLHIAGENLRYLDEYAPGSFERFNELTQISGQTKIPRARLMIEELLANNQQMIDLLNQCFAEAEQENQQGIADFVAGRLSQHGKYHWQLRSYLKDARA